MNLREFPVDQGADADIFAALLGLIPTRGDGKILLLSRAEVMHKMEELSQAGDEEGVRLLLSELEFDGEAVFKGVFTQMSSKSVRVETTTMFRMLLGMSETMETRNDLMRRILAPLMAELFDSVREGMDGEKADLLHYSIDGWLALKRPGSEEVDSQDVRGSRGASPSFGGGWKGTVFRKT